MFIVNMSTADQPPKRISNAKMIAYLKQHTGDLSIDERRDVLQMLVNSTIPDKKLQTKGGGTQVKFRDIPETVVNTIYSYVHTRVSSKRDELQYFPDGEELASE